MNETTIRRPRLPLPRGCAAWWCAGWERAWVSVPFGPNWESAGNGGIAQENELWPSRAAAANEPSATQVSIRPNQGRDRGGAGSCLDA
jgi:hypothetical protein